MTERTSATVDQPAWSVEAFAPFWANPDPAHVPAILTKAHGVPYRPGQG